MDQSSRPDGQVPPQAVLAMVGDRAVTLGSIQQELIEAAGGQTLLEVLLDRMVHDRLAKRGTPVTADDMAQEKEALLASLSDQPDTAQRLLTELRARRGWGERRFAGMLQRNAGLRKLVQAEVQVTPASIQQAYDLEYGRKYETRLITTDTFPQATALLARARGGESFSDLAVQQSTDESRAQGGLLPPISVEDTTFPAAVRAAVKTLSPGQVSDPIALDKQFALLKLERILPAQAVPVDAVKERLTRAVRRQMERQGMERLAREMIGQANVTVLDPALQKSWRDQRRAMEPAE